LPLRAPSLETTARPQAISDALAAPLPRDASVYITALHGTAPDAVVAAAARLRRAGLNPVPHLGARYIASAGALDDLLCRLTLEAGVSQVLLVGGDIAQAEGPFAASLDVLRSGLLVRHGILRVGLAGYPEAHPRIPAAMLDAALAAKIAAARGAGHAVHIVTQFCFAAGPIAAWLARFGARFPDVPVHVGLAGPASVATLLKYGLACGIGPSLRALSRNRGLIRLAEADPLPIMAALAQDAAAVARIAQFHFFTFGGVRRTAEWLAARPDEGRHEASASEKRLSAV
jgi:methylenetetrahydrofolate reductase (NADPH)